VAELTGIVERLELELGPARAAPTPLHGGITNRNYRTYFGETEYVIRLPGKDTSLLGISREAERLANRAAAEIGIAPPVAAGNDECLVTEFLGAQPLEPPQVAAHAGDVAGALRAFHDSAVELPARFWVPELLDSYAHIVTERGGSLPAEYASTQDLVGKVAAVLPLVDPTPCHNDLLPANILDRDGQVVLVDWEYAGMGHRFFDLGNLAVNNEFDSSAEEELLAVYLRAEPGAEHRAALQLMKIMSDAREAAWGVVQGVISELDFDFSAYARKHFDRLQHAASDPRLSDWLDAAAA
jgi:thiamine kinase-like enzyme